MAEPRLTRRATEDLGSLPRSIQDAVLETILAIGIEPEGTGHELRGRLEGLWSARVGNYRVLYTIEGRSGATQVIVRAIRHRAVAYRTRRPPE